jgi:signal transduction histidine kinase
MTHEIMNSIAPVTSLSETMLFMHRDAAVSPESLKQNTLEAFETISSTASGLLSFVESYRKFTAVPKPKIQDFSLNTLVDKVVKLHETLVRQKNIELTVSIPETLTLSADENLISQALINLVKNAVEAVGEGMEGKITISADSMAADRLCIHVANSGKPIPADILPHIFVPFFTTKPSGS